ncbi:hypothetical protein NPIL_424931 [Nephila pilipes]|uniref:Uncharacterized protein n=1 Tax=Nephila pilipes TaxID=299642 RepID=A0A8X6NVN2_NEPPI|nr:hypothetical protein NPIL_424931 [Nephila pilipes]
MVCMVTDIYSTVEVKIKELGTGVPFFTLFNDFEPVFTFFRLNVANALVLTAVVDPERTRPCAYPLDPPMLSTLFQHAILPYSLS